MAQLTLTSTRLTGTFVSTRDSNAATTSFADTAPINADITFTPVSTASHPQSAKMADNPEGFGVVFEPVRARIVNGKIKPYLSGGATVVALPTFKEAPQLWRVTFDKVTFSGKPVHGGIKPYEFRLPAMPTGSEFDIVKALPLYDGDYSVASARVYVMDVITNSKNELVFVMSDGSQQVLSHSFFDQAAADAAAAHEASASAQSTASTIKAQADAIQADARDAREKSNAAWNTANNALSQVSSKVTTFVGPDEPPAAGLRMGDMWFDTSTDPWSPFVWSGLEWMISADPVARTAASAAQNSADIAREIADGKIESFYTPTAPASSRVSLGDLWIKTPENLLHRWNGTSWTQIQDTGIADAHDKATTAIASAGYAAAKADSKALTYVQATEPTGLDFSNQGDFWYNTATDPWTPFVWSGYMWVQSKDADATAAANAATEAVNAIRDELGDVDGSTGGLFGLYLDKLGEDGDVTKDLLRINAVLWDDQHGWNATQEAINEAQMQINEVNEQRINDQEQALNAIRKVQQSALQQQLRIARITKTSHINDTYFTTDYSAPYTNITGKGAWTGSVYIITASTVSQTGKDANNSEEIVTYEYSMPLSSGSRTISISDRQITSAIIQYVVNPGVQKKRDTISTSSITLPYDVWTADTRHTFTAPVSGNYSIFFRVTWGTPQAMANYGIEIQRNGTWISSTGVNGYLFPSKEHSLRITDEDSASYFNAGDTIKFRLFAGTQYEPGRVATRVETKISWVENNV